MIIDLIKNYIGETTTVSSFGVADFVFDCALEESHESRLQTTDNKIESGASISDHSYLEPQTYSVRGLMVSYKPFTVVPLAANEVISAAKTLPALTGIVGKTEQVVAKVNRYAGRALQAVDIAKNAANKLSPFMPDSLKLLGDNTSETLTRQAQALAQLKSIQNSGQFLTVTSGLQIYTNMQLIGVIANKGTDDSVEFALQFKETPIVSTRTVQGLVVNVPTPQQPATTKVDGEKKTGRSENQAAKVKSKGKTQPVQQPKTKKSVARSIGDVIRGL